jgi:hypothetical protein
MSDTLVGCLHFAAESSVIQTYHRPSLSPVRSLAAYRLANSQAIDGMLVEYMDDAYHVIGSYDAVLSGIMIASLQLPVGDTVRQLHIWTDDQSTSIRGVHIMMDSSVTHVLDASLGNSFSQASLQMNGSSLGSGIMLGLTAVVQPSSVRGSAASLLAMGFNFLDSPVSSAIAVDMPVIDLDSNLTYTPVYSSTSTIRVEGSAANITCKSTKITYTRRSAYAQQAVAQRYKQLLSSISQVQITRSNKLSSELQWLGLQSLPGGSNRTDEWKGQILDIFDTEAELITDGGITIEVETPSAEFMVPSGYEATCFLVYGSVRLVVDYTLTVTVFFDVDGNNSWTTQLAGQYVSQGHTVTIQSVAVRQIATATSTRRPKGEHLHICV